MCTVTFVPRDVGYYLAMNRDEKWSRIAGLPPKRRFIEGRFVLYPSEPSGGTWISVNEAGASFALLNWYSVTARVGGQGISRGEVVKSLAAASGSNVAAGQLQKLPLARMNPFRLIGVFPAEKEIVEWNWDLRTLKPNRLRWKAQQWISSGFDEPAAQQIRGAAFRNAQWQPDSGSLDWLRRLHRSHSPHRGAFSTCVHRSDAGSVSYTEISVSAESIDMNYLPASPCQYAEETDWCCEPLAHTKRGQSTSGLLVLTP